MALTETRKEELYAVLERTGGHREAWKKDMKLPQWYLDFQDRVTRRSVTVEAPVPVTCYITTAKDRAENCPVHVNFHGGGFIFPQNADDDRYCARLAAELRGIVVDVDYAHSDRHPFPAALEQSWAVMKWVFSRCESWGADPKRVSMGGHSAGGALVEAVTMRAARTGEFRVCMQVLDYAASDSRNEPDAPETPGNFLSRERCLALSEFYCGGEEHLLSSPELSPVLAPDEWLRDLPPTVFLHAGYCPFTRINTPLARRMVDAGVEVTQRLFPASHHAFTIRLLDQWQEGQEFILRMLKGASL